MSTDWVKSVKADRFQCITLDVSRLVFSDKEDFKLSLQENVETWKAAGIRGLSIKIPLEHCALVETCSQLDFDFHHAKPGYVMMNKWLLEGQPNQLPAYANQYIGAGGFVVNDRQQVLVIREKFLQNPHWKLPGGHVDQGEEIPAACQREVFEETGVNSEFVSLLAFRHQHNYRFGCSDIYFVCLMRPVSEDITPCEKEIAQCKWMDLDEYEKANITDANQFYVAQYRKIVQENLHISAQPVLAFDRSKENLIFSIQNQK